MLAKIDNLAELVIKNMEDYNLNFLIAEVDGIKWGEIRVDSKEQVNSYVMELLKELNILDAGEFFEDDAIEFSWYIASEPGKELNLYLI